MGDGGRKSRSSYMEEQTLHFSPGEIRGFKTHPRDFAGGAVAKIPHSQCRKPRLEP